MASVTSLMSRNNVSRLFDELYNESDDSDEEIISSSGADNVLCRVLDRQPMIQAENNKILDEDEDENWVCDDYPPLVQPFTGYSYVNIDLSGGSEPIDFFNYFINDSIFDSWVEQTNLYAESRTDVTYELPEHSRIRNWTNVTRDEMKVFFALIITTGLIKKDELKQYWAVDHVLGTPFFPKHMSLKRFESILANFHLADNAADDGSDPLYKVRPFFSHIRQAFLQAYSPSENLSFDEATCPYKGRLRFKVYNPKKPAKFGIKIYEVCESESGYVLGMNVYTGNSEEDTFYELADVPVDSATTTKIVTGLLAYCGLLGKGHKVYLDNYYVSPELFTELTLLGTGACGTVRTNRKGMPTAVKPIAKIKLAQGETIFRRKVGENLLAVRYFDKRDVNALSTIHSATSVLLNKRDADGNRIRKPELIVDYIKNMGGVDTSDQIVKNYSCVRKTVKWWKKFFFHLFCVTICNSYVLYKKSVGNQIDHFQFRLSIVKSLIHDSPANPGPSTSGRKLVDPPERLVRNFPHFPEYFVAKEGAKRKRPSRDCVVCNVSSSKRVGYKRKQTAFQCKHCKIPLCVPECFERYHTRSDYKTT